MHWKNGLSLFGTGIFGAIVCVIAENTVGEVAGIISAMIIAFFGAPLALAIVDRNEDKLLKIKEQEKHAVESKKNNDETFQMDLDEWKKFATTHLIEGISPLIVILIETLEKIKGENEQLEIKEKHFYQSVLCSESYKVCYAFSQFKPEEQETNKEEMLSVLEELNERANELLHKVNVRKNREFEKQSRILRNKLKAD